MDAVLDGRPRKAHFPAAEADAVMGRFIAGHFITVGRRRETDAHFKLLEGVDEVWALCFRKPRPGWRVLGRFLEPDVFVGLREADRHELVGRRYAELASEVVQQWQLRFGPLEPFRSDDLTAYLTGLVRDVDRKDDER